MALRDGQYRPANARFLRRVVVMLLGALALVGMTLTVAWPHLPALFLRQALGLPLIVHGLLGLLLMALTMATATLKARLCGPITRWLAPGLLTLLGIRLLSWRVLESLPTDGGIAAAAIAWALLLAEAVGWSALLVQVWHDAACKPSATTPTAALANPDALAPLPLRVVIVVSQGRSSADARDVYRTALACQALGVAGPDIVMVRDNAAPDYQAIADTLGVGHLTRRPHQPLWAFWQQALLAPPAPDTAPPPFVLILQAGQLPTRAACWQALEAFEASAVGLAEWPCQRRTPDGRLRNLGLWAALHGVGHAAPLNDASAPPAWLLRRSCVAATTGTPPIAERVLAGVLADTGVFLETLGPALQAWVRAQGYRAETCHANLPSLHTGGGADWQARAGRADRAAFSRGMGHGPRALLALAPSLRRAARLMFLLSPALALLAGVSPWATGRWELVMFYAPLWLALHLHPLTARTGASQTLNEVMGALGSVRGGVLALWAAIQPRSLQGEPWGATLPAWTGFSLLLGLTLLALGAGLHPARGLAGSAGATQILMIWAILNALLLAAALCAAVDRPQRRASPRVMAATPCVLQCADRTLAFGEVQDISETGVRVAFSDPIPLRGPCQITFLGSQPALDEPLRVRAVRSALDAQACCRVAFQFEDLPVSAHRALAMAMIHWAHQTPERPSPPAYGAWDSGETWRTWSWLLMAPFCRWQRSEKPSRRQTVRLQKALSCTLHRGQRVWRAVVRDISEHGMAVYAQNFPRRGSAHTSLQARILWDDGQTTCLPTRLVRMRSDGLSGSEQHEVGLAFETLSAAEWQDWIGRLYPMPAAQRVRTAFDVPVSWPCRLRVAGAGTSLRATVLEISPLRATLSLEALGTLTVGTPIELDLLHSGLRLNGMVSQVATPYLHLSITNTDWITLALLARQAQAQPVASPTRTTPQQVRQSVSAARTVAVHSG